MEKLIEMAQELGRQIAANERTVLLKKAQKMVDEDREADNLVKEYQQQGQKIQKLEMEQKPIEVADKHALREIEQKISANESLKEMTKRQVEFVDLMRKIKQAIDEQLEI